MQGLLTETADSQPSEHGVVGQVECAPVRESAPGSWELLRAFLRLGATSFGGPAMVAYIKSMAVTRKGWLSEADFQQGVALCQAAPGATAMQCAAYVGLRVKGPWGALLAYIGFGLPAFLLMLSLSVAYRHAVQFQPVVSVFEGLGALVVALVANAAWVFGRSSVKKLGDASICLLTAFFFHLGASPFLIVLAAGLSGSLLLRKSAPAPPHDSHHRGTFRTAWGAAVLIFALGLTFVCALAVLDSKLVPLALVMMKVDVSAFGGGFASLPLLFREVVEVRHWLSARIFMDGIMLGQLTPGPIVITSTFVGYQAAGFAGAIVATACMFLPSFLVILLLEPVWGRLRSSSTFQGATRALVLSFVGLLASLTVQLVVLTPWKPPSILVASLAFAALRFRVDVLWVVLAGMFLIVLATFIQQVVT